MRAKADGQKLNRSLVSKHSVLLDWWGYAHQLIIYEAKIRNLEGAYLALSSVNKGAPVCVRLCLCLSYGEGWCFAVRSPFPEHERVQGFQELRAQVKSNTVHTQEGGCVDSM